MEISVLMSVYGKERADFLQSSLQSIWDDQTLKPNQIILIKDGPLSQELDNVIDIWKEKIPEVMCILANEHNIGLTRSLNRGLEYATGDYIARMDSDDISMPNRFKAQTEFLSENPDIMVVGGALQEFDENNPCILVRHYPTNKLDIKKYICKASPLAHPTVMIRKEVFSKGGLKYNEKYRTSQDLALWFDVLKKGYYITNLEEITIMFRRSNDLMRRRSKKKAKNEFKIYMNGIYSLYGILSWRYVFPISRFVLRMLPLKIIKTIYDSNIRSKILQIHHS